MPSTGVVAGAVKHNKKILVDKNFGNCVEGTHDCLLPINGAVVTLLNKKRKKLQTYITDEFYNGVYVFWDIKPGK